MVAFEVEMTDHNGAMRLKESVHKFLGDSAQCWENLKNNNDQIFENYWFSDNQILRYLHNLLCKNSNQFFQHTVEPIAKSYKDAVWLIQEENNFIVRQTRVNTILSGPRCKTSLNAGMAFAAGLASFASVFSPFCIKHPCRIEKTATKLISYDVFL